MITATPSASIRTGRRVFIGLDFSAHSRLQMAARNITEADVDLAVAFATKTLTSPSKFGCVNVWGFGVAGNRIRVTIDTRDLGVLTVANADSRVA
jgi:hypothetical protein